jgi:chemotaxis response regulator CheB
MVNKDQLEQTPEGKQVLALMEEHFSEEQFQPALTLIEQRYTEDETVWDADLNRESKLPFLKTHAAHRLLVFFDSPDHLQAIQDELARREEEHAATVAEATDGNGASVVKPKVKGKTKAKAKTKPKAKAKVVRKVHKVRRVKVTARKTAKKKAVKSVHGKAKAPKRKVSKVGRSKGGARRVKASKGKSKRR